MRSFAELKGPKVFPCSISLSACTLQRTRIAAVVGQQHALQERRSYFFFRFSRLTLKDPRVASSTASRAGRLMRVVVGGKANG
jgi:hypothetical protein